MKVSAEAHIVTQQILTKGIPPGKDAEEATA